MTVGRNVLLKNRCSSFRYLVEPVNKISSAHAQRIEYGCIFIETKQPNLKRILQSFLMSEE